MNDCISELEKDIENEIDGINEDSAIAEQLEQNDTDFTKDGKIFNY